MSSGATHKNGSSDLPGFSLGVARQIIGREAVAKLVLHFGGRRVYVPQSGGPNSVLARVIGEEATDKLADLWGSSTVAVPSDSGSRNQGAVLERSRAGKTIAAIARETGLTERRVYKIRAELRAAGQLA